LDFLSIEEGLELISKSIERIITKKEIPLAIKIVEECGNLPIAISIASSLIKFSTSRDPLEQVLFTLNHTSQTPFQETGTDTSLSWFVESSVNL
jgi:hypothetical protein